MRSLSSLIDPRSNLAQLPIEIQVLIASFLPPPPHPLHRWCSNCGGRVRLCNYSNAWQWQCILCRLRWTTLLSWVKWPPATRIKMFYSFEASRSVSSRNRYARAVLLTEPLYQVRDGNKFLAIYRPDGSSGWLVFKGSRLNRYFTYHMT